MSVKITGEKQLLAELEKRFGKAKMQQISDKALKAGAEVFIAELKTQLSTFSRAGKGMSEGYTHDEVTATEPETVGGVRTIKIHWMDGHGRYRIIHLNEFGTVKNPNPSGKGAIARAMRNAESAYREAIKKAVQEGI